MECCDARHVNGPCQYVNLKKVGGVMALNDDGSVGRGGSVGRLTGVATTFGLTAKRTFDIGVAAISLIILSPLISVVCAAIKLESGGPVFLRETVYGYNNQAIRTYKFRSAIVYGAAGANEYLTWVGQILQRTGIVELPRFFNVLTGEMSIVGPRPYACRQYLNDDCRIFLLAYVKPGMTGCDRVTGFCEKFNSNERRINEDLRYAKDWSLFLDIKIILATLRS